MLLGILGLPNGSPRTCGLWDTILLVCKLSLSFDLVELYMFDPDEVKLEIYKKELYQSRLLQYFHFLCSSYEMAL